MIKWKSCINLSLILCSPFLLGQGKTNRDTIDLAKDPSHASPLRLISDPTAFLKTFEEDTELGIRFGLKKAVLKDKCHCNKQKVNLQHFTFQLKGPVNQDKSPVNLIDLDGLTGTNSFDFGYTFLSGPPVVPEQINKHLPPIVDRVITELEAELKKKKAAKQDLLKRPEFPEEIIEKVSHLKEQIRHLEKKVINLRYKRAVGTISSRDLPGVFFQEDEESSQLLYKDQNKSGVEKDPSISYEQNFDDLVDKVIEEMEAAIKELKTTKSDLTSKPTFYPRIEEKLEGLTEQIQSLEAKINHLRFTRAEGILSMSDLPDDPIIDENGKEQKSYQKQYRQKLLEDHANARKVFGFNYQVGQKNFKYVTMEDLITPMKENLEADKFTAFVGYMPGGNNFVDRNSFVGVNYQRQSYYKGQTVQELCQPAPISETETSDTVTACNSIAVGEPTKVEEDLVQFEYRRLVKNFGFSVRYTYNLDEKKWAASIPVYFIRSSRGALPNGGLALGYNNKDREVTLSAFVGQGFKLF